MKNKSFERELRPLAAIVELTKGGAQEEPVYFSHERVMEKVLELFGNGPFGNNSDRLIGYFLPFVDQGYLDKVSFERRQGRSQGKRSEIYRANLERCKELESEFPQTRRE